MAAARAIVKRVRFNNMGYSLRPLFVELAVTFAAFSRLRDVLLRVTFWLDAGLLAGFCLVESTGFTGMIVHEWLGIALAAMVLVHLLFSWTWISSTARRFLAASV